MDVRSDCSESMVGSCQAMCPLAEHQARQQQKRLSVFEIPSNSHKNFPVKEYSRCAAGKETSLSELRPEGVLVKTMNYLIEEIVDRTDHSWTAVYHFVFDRIRAIRQDLVIQRIANESTVEILEKAVRFHIFAHYKLYGSSLEWYDPFINDSHLQECLKRLLVLYDCSVASQNRAEFEAYYLLHNLGSHEAIERILKLPESIKAQHCLKSSLRLSLMFLLGNFVSIFRITKKLPFLACCLIQKHSLSIRSNAIAVLNTAFSNPNCRFPLAIFSDILDFGSTDAAKDFVPQFGIEVVDDYIKFSKKDFSTEPLKSTAVKNYSLTSIDSFIPGSAKEILQGKATKLKNESDKETNLPKTKTDHTGHFEDEKVKGVVYGRGRGVRNLLAEQMQPQPGKGRGRGRGRGRARVGNNPIS